MQYIVDKLTDIGKLEAPPKMEGKQLYAYFLPDKNKVQTLKDSITKDKKSISSEKGEEKTNIISEEVKVESKIITDPEINPDVKIDSRIEANPEIKTENQNIEKEDA